MRSFWIRTVNLLAVIVVLCGYNMILSLRDSRDESAKLSAELESIKLEWEADRQRLSVVQADSEAAQVDQMTGDMAERFDGKYQDGTYHGEAQGFGGVISLEVTIEDGMITDITILSAGGEDGTYLSMAKNMIPAMIEEQTAEVDTVGGATFSSNGIRNAAAQALEKAGK